MRNRTTEKDIRAWLNANGFEGKTAKIADVELHAVRRPGWLQIFRFRLNTETGAHFGVVRDDERLRGKDKTRIELFDNVGLQEAKLAELSEDLIVRGDRSGGYLGGVFVLGIVLLVCTAALFNMFCSAQ